MEKKYLITLMALVDLSVNYSVHNERRENAHQCAYWYKCWISSTLFPIDEHEEHRANHAKEKCKEYPCGIKLNFDID